MDRFAKALRDSVALKEAIADDVLVASKADLRSLPAPASKRAPLRQHNVRVNDRLRPRRTSHVTFRYTGPQAVRYYYYCKRLKSQR